MIEFLFKFGDLISALLGLIAAIILAAPAISAITAKRNWEAIRKMERENAADQVVADTMRDIRRFAEAPQLGDSRGALWTNAWGFSFLGLSFAFLFIASLGRATGAAG